MRKFIVNVGGEKFEVELEEVGVGNGSAAVAAKQPENPGIKSKISMPISAPKSGSVIVDAPMPGNIVKMPVEVGQEVSKGQTLFVLEAMKMENEIASPASGKIAEIRANAGDAVSAGQAVIVIE